MEGQHVKLILFLILIHFISEESGHIDRMVTDGPNKFQTASL